MVRNRVAANMISNWGGSIVVALLALAFIPLYIRYLGIGGYGLVGFFITLQSVFALLDLGLSMSLTRELAAMSGSAETSRDARDLVRTLEIIYWLLAVIVGVVVTAGAPFIAQHWIKSAALAPEVVQRSVMLMGIAVALQMPTALYTGGLTGLQRQVLLNSIVVIGTLVRSAGAVLVLAFVSATVPAYFIWNIAVIGIQTAAIGLCLWRLLPEGHGRATFRPDLLRRVYRFAAGMVGIGILSTLLTQADKIVLSKVLSLESFGYYTLAYTVGASLYRLTAPVTSALFPRLTQAVAHEPERMPALYHRSAQVLSVAALPAAVVLIAFAPEVLLLWTGSAVTAENTSDIARLLVAGTALSGLMGVPYITQLAYGWTRLSIYVNTVAVAILTPCVYFAALRWGGVGAAAIWFILNLGYILIGVQPMYRRYLHDERLRWYVVDIGQPLLASIAVVLVARALWVPGMSAMLQLTAIIVISSVTLFAGAMAAPTVRAYTLSTMRNLRAGLQS